MMSCIAKFNFLVSQKQKLLSNFRDARMKIPIQMAEFESLQAQIEENTQQDNVVLVSRLGDIYLAILGEFLKFKPEEILVRLLAKFDELYPEETEHIRQFINVYKFNNGRMNGLLKGAIQSGKTMIIVLTMLCYLVCNRDCIIIVRNKNDDKKQFIDRFNQVVNDLKEHLYTHPNFVIGTDSMPNHPCAFVEIYNTPNLRKLYTRIQGRDLKNAVLYIDEADLRETYTAKIFQKVGKIMYVSATVQDILAAEWEIRADNIMKLTTPSSYKGISNLEIIDCDLSTPEKICNIICDIAIDNEYKLHHPTHPKIILLNIERTLNGMERIKNWFINGSLPSDDVLAGDIYRQLDNPVVIKYTGKGIFVHSNRFAENEMPKTSSIRETLNWLANNGGHERFPNIIIIASGMADRGINFADYKSGYHLTHQILLKPASSNCANVIQGCRILGIHNDSIPLKLYTTKETKDKIVKGYDLSEDILGQLEESKMPEQFVNEVCKKEVVIYEDNIPERFLAKKNVKKVFKVKKSKTQDNVELQPELMNDDKIVDWLQNKDTKKARFLRMCSPTKVYTKEEILRMLEKAEFIQPQSMFSSITNPNTVYGEYYLQRVSQNGWKIRDDISHNWNVLNQ